MDIKGNINIHNRFDIEVFDTKTGKIRQRAQGHNVILQALWDILCFNGWVSETTGAYDGFHSAIFYGSGSGTPAATDTDLFTREGYKASNSPDDNNRSTYANFYTVDYEHRVISLKRKIVLSETEAVGVNLTEVGIGTKYNNGTLCTHAMLEDMNGNPISILKTNTDVITIYATVYCHWSNSLNIFFPLPNLDSYWVDKFAGWVTGRYRGLYYTNYASYKKAASFVPLSMTGQKEFIPPKNMWYDGTIIEPIRVDNGRTYDYVDSLTADSTAKTIVVKAYRRGVDNGNVGGIGTIGFYIAPSNGSNGMACIALHTDDFYSGDNITGEAAGTGDGTTTEFAVKFDFPESATVYVNGAQRSSGVTVKRVPLTTYALGHYVRQYRNLSVKSEKFAGYQNSSVSYTIPKDTIIYNQAYGVGFASISNTGTGRIYGSNDRSTWSLLASPNAGTVTLTGADQHFKYYKNDGGASAVLNWNSNTGKAIVFDTAPANGDVITIDYHTPYIAKDSDHVYDMTVTFQFGEYSE